MPISLSNAGLFFLSLIFLSHYLVSAASPSPSPAPDEKQSYSPKRPDPLSHFKSYHGGYNISSPHYLGSAVFTGVHGYAVAGVWMMIGMGFAVFVVIKYLNWCTCSSSIAIRDHSYCYYLIPFLVVILCTFLVIVASSFVLAANHSSLLRTKKLENTILRVAKVAHGTIRKVTRAIQKMRRLLYPYNKAACVQLTVTARKLTKESQTIRRVLYWHTHSIDRDINIWYRTTAGIVSGNLVLVVAALVVLLLHWHPGFIMIIFLCWILTTLCWILTGFHFFLHTFADDTCYAFEKFQQNPGNNSLSPILPCADEVHADQVMADVGSMVHNFISKTNLRLTNLSALLGLDDQAKNSFSGYFNICNPFTGPPDYKYNPNNCSKDAIAIGDIPDVLQRFTCYGNNPTIPCEEVGRKFISKASYNMAMVYVETIQELLDVLPDIDNLVRCSFVKDTISDILAHQCRPLTKSLKLAWLSILSLSTTMVILVLAWVAKLYQNRGRSFSRCSLVPS
ncbi:hypothetical protein ACHQM5_024894 [Ranunculus cassubicifolius]